MDPFSPFIGRRRQSTFQRRQSQVPSDLIDWDAPEIPELEKQRIIYEQIIQEIKEDYTIENLINEQLAAVASDVLVETMQKRCEEQLQKDRSQINLLLGQIKIFEAHSQELESHLKSFEEKNKELENQTKKLALELDERDKLLEQRTQETSDYQVRQKELEERADRLASDLENREKVFEDRVKKIASEYEVRQKELEERADKLASDLEDREKVFEDRAKKIASEYEVRHQELESRAKDLAADLEERYRDLEFQKLELEAEISCLLDTLLLKKNEADDLRLKLELSLTRLSYYKKLAPAVAS